MITGFSQGNRAGTIRSVVAVTITLGCYECIALQVDPKKSEALYPSAFQPVFWGGEISGQK